MLRLYTADHQPTPITKSATLAEFFEDWYVPAAETATQRKPISAKTLERRRDAVTWWRRILGTAEHPDGPPLYAITEQQLAEFATGLESATYQRGGPYSTRHKLAPSTRASLLREIQIVLASTGPANKRKLRAGLFDSPPWIYTEPIATFPKPRWSMDEARKIAKAAANDTPLPRWPAADALWPALAAATVALWFYTGHRATTYQRLNWSDLVEIQPGQWVLDIRESVKTGKPDRCAVHPQLLARLDALRPLTKGEAMFPWPHTFGAIRTAHKRWQAAADISAGRTYSPQAWRRLHGDAIAETGYTMARDAAASSLGHSSATVTESSYSQVKNLAILRLPDLF